MYHHSHTPKKYIPWNKGKLIGQKPPLKLKEICSIRTLCDISNVLRIKVSNKELLRIIKWNSWVIVFI